MFLSKLCFRQQARLTTLIKPRACCRSAATWPAAPLQVVPLALVELGKSIQGRVLCCDDHIYLQIGGASQFEALNKEIEGNAPFKYFTEAELQKLKVDSMVLCKGCLRDILVESMSEAGLSKYAASNKLYRARLLLCGADDLLDRERVRGKRMWLWDSFQVELVDLGVKGEVHKHKLIHLPEQLLAKPALAIVVGFYDSSDLVQYVNADGTCNYDDEAAGERLAECAQYVPNVLFTPDYVQSDDAHLPECFGGGWFDGSCVRRTGGRLKFIMPENVRDVPPHVIDEIKSRVYAVRTRHGDIAENAEAESQAERVAA